MIQKLNVCYSKWAKEWEKIFLHAPSLIKNNGKKLQESVLEEGRGSLKM